jgi:hypothetical protein
MIFEELIFNYIIIRLGTRIRIAPENDALIFLHRFNWFNHM